MTQGINSTPNNQLETFIRTTWTDMWSGDPPVITTIGFIEDSVIVKFGIWSLCLCLFENEGKIECEVLGYPSAMEGVGEMKVFSQILHNLMNLAESAVVFLTKGK